MMKKAFWALLPVLLTFGAWLFWRRRHSRNDPFLDTFCCKK